MTGTMEGPEVPMRRPPARLASLVLAGVAATASGGCGKTGEDAFTPQAVAAAAKEAGTVNGLCPIMKKPVIPGDATEYKGEKIGFCCPGCSTMFLKAPEKYLAAMAADPVRYGFKQP